MAQELEDRIDLAKVQTNETIRELHARLGKNPERLAYWNVILETVDTMSDETTLPEEKSMMLENAIRAFGMSDLLPAMRGGKPAWMQYAPGDLNVTAEQPQQQLSQEQLTDMYGPAKSGNTYDPQDPMQLLGYVLYQKGLSKDQIAPLIMQAAGLLAKQPTSVPAESTSGR
jgi:hypothetical protein